MGEPLVSGLENFVARPGQSLEKHLIQAAFTAGDPEGSPTEQLLFLAGLLHDAGKARRTWQDYFERSLAGSKEKMPHAYVGAALFALYGRDLLDAHTASLKTEQLYYLLVRDVEDHHGKLGDWWKPHLNQSVPPWKSLISSQPPEDTAFAALDALARRHLPSLSGNPITDYDIFKERLAHLENGWDRAFKKHRMKLKRELGAVPSAYASWISRDTTGRLIAADRLSASGLSSEMALSSDNARDALQTFKSKLKEKHRKAVEEGHGLMADKRSAVHEQALISYAKNADAPWFALSLPVGWGKTLISLRVALERAAAGPAERIVYVAPYLSILSQAAKEIREVTGLEVMEHHHLALLNAAPTELDSSEEIEPVDVLTMESWRAPIIATTFNQLFRAVFPKSAQQSIRIPALKGAFIIVDEPQVMDASVYNAFIRGLEALRARSGARVMLVSATIPPTLHALTTPPVPIAPEVESADRYTLVTHIEQWTEERVAQETLQRFRQYGQVAVILNTIADAVKVYRRIAELIGEDACMNLHGMMTPLHKAHQVERVKKRLDHGDPVLVVSTQVLEAGLNVSFRRVLRARSIFSSVAQTAGRANRHAEGSIATVEIFDFVREEGADSRKWIYKNEHQTRVTDELLPAGGRWSEAQTTGLIEAYFDELSYRDPNTAALQWFESAAKGQWSKLAGLSPFDTLDEDGSNELAEQDARVFVLTGEVWMTRLVKSWMEHFGIKNVSGVYASYTSKSFLKSLDFDDRRRFLSLVGQFTVPIRKRLISRICGEIDTETTGILRAQDDNDYHLDTGFGHLLLREDFDDFDRRLDAAFSRSHNPDHL
jgi:CRISPR-associated helicase Cas3/CRISPR-associated endonuclease Cas3-HD